MATYFYDGKEQPSPRGRITIKDGVIDDIIMMEGMSDINGRNIKFIGEIISQLIYVINKQNKEISKLKKEEKDVR